MPADPPANENHDLPDDLLDRAAQAFSVELDHWQIVGPLENKYHKDLPPQVFYRATRRTEQMGYAPIAAISVVLDTPPEIKIIDFKDKASAVSCLQWHGVKAAIEAVRKELAEG